jgi:transcriptional regulator with XRE-family HTH domain
MVAKRPHPDEFGFAELAPLILKPLRTMRGVSPPEMADRMEISTRAYQDFEKGRTALFLDRVRQFAEILKLDHYAILAAFHLRKPRIAHVFAHNKFMLVQASAVDEFDEEMQDAIAAVDPLTVLDAHMQFYEQLAKLGREQIRTANGERPKV